jgi:hypothetical protein
VEYWFCFAASRKAQRTMVIESPSVLKTKIHLTGLTCSVLPFLEIA